jgi:SAM-dependent methyltransferase
MPGPEPAAARPTQNPWPGCGEATRLARVTSSDVWTEETAATYDADAADHFSPEVLGPTVDLLARLAGEGPVLELAVGTGRVALALADRGLPVTGIELSEPMAARLRAKDPDGRVPVVVGDMATSVAPGAGAYTLVYLAWNSISNLRTQAEQVQCFRNAARHLRPRGRFVIDLWVPALQRLTPGQEAVPVSIGEDHLVFDTYDVVSQECSSHHYRTLPDGTVHHDVGHFRYIWPAECDLMAQLAGLRLESRWADWAGTPFTATSEAHVSVWRKP